MPMDSFRTLRLRSFAAALVAVVVATASPAWASDIVDVAVADMRRVIGTGDVDAISTALMETVKRVDAEKGRLSPESIELAERLGRVFLEGGGPEIAALLFERAHAMHHRLDPKSPRTAKAAFDRAVALHRVDPTKGWDAPLEAAFALWRELDLASADSVQAGFVLGRRDLERGRPRAAAETFAAALRLGGGRRDEAAEREANNLVEFAERRLVVAKAADTADLVAARATVLEALGEAGARRAVTALRQRLRRSDDGADPATGLAIRRRVVEILARSLAGDLHARRDAARDLGDAAVRVGDAATAAHAWDDAVDLTGRLAGTDTIEVADMAMAAGESLADLGGAPEVQAMAAAQFARALALRETLLPANDVRIADTALRLFLARHLCRLTGDDTRVDEQEQLLQRALAILEAATPPDHLRLSDVHGQISQVRYLVGDSAGWLAHARRAVAEADLSGDVLARIVTRMGLARALPPGDDGEIDRVLDEWAALAETIAEAKPHWLMGALAARAEHDLGRGRWATADRAARRAAGLGVGRDEREAVTILEQLARVAAFFGRADDAAELLERAAAVATRTADNVVDRLAAARLAARAAIRRGDLEGAEKRLAEALAHQEAAFGADDSSNGALHALYGRVLRDRGDLAGAETHLRRALDMQRRDAVADVGGTVALRSDVAALLVQRGAFGEAIRLHEENAADLAAGAVVGDARRAQIAASTAEALLGADRPDEALAAARRAAAIVTARVSGDAADPQAAAIREAEVRRAADVFRVKVRATWAAAHR
jgi:tetratricopeptide (TPR) repeat protein